MDLNTLLMTLILGGVVGFSLGLTGGGGAIFAVPMLVYGLGVPAKESVGISLLTVACTAGIGFVQRARMKRVDFPIGMVFAVAGMLGAPVGSRLASTLPDTLLMVLFAGLMVMIAIRMWWKAHDRVGSIRFVDAENPIETNAGAVCKLDSNQRLRLTSRCGLLLAAVGVGAGVLSGMFGVGGGFIIVPALVAFASMEIQTAIGTSLLVITMVSFTGTASHVLAGKDLSVETSILFTSGSIAGLFLGSGLSQRLAGPTLQRVFALAILLVAAYVLVRTAVLS
jgi:uncharacterized protein